MSELLKDKAVSGAKWTIFRTVFIAGLGPILQILKARFLMPEEFAYIAIIMIALGLFKTVENFGISHAIIQRNKISVEEASSLFYVNIILSLLFGMALYILSPTLSSIFSMPDLSYYLRLACIIAIIGGPAQLFRAYLEKNLYFKHLSIIPFLF